MCIFRLTYLQCLFWRQLVNKSGQKSKISGIYLSIPSGKTEMHFCQPYTESSVSENTSLTSWFTALNFITSTRDYRHLFPDLNTAYSFIREISRVQHQKEMNLMVRGQAAIERNKVWRWTKSTRGFSGRKGFSECSSGQTNVPLETPSARCKCRYLGNTALVY